MKNKNQLNLFKHIDYEKAKTYKDLNINQRINVKANSCGFASNYIRQLKYYLNFPITRWDSPDKISLRYYNHVRINKYNVRVSN